MNPIKEYKLGVKYLKVQPRPFHQKTLVFPELNMARLLKRSTQFMPPFIVLVLSLYFLFHASFIMTLIAVIIAFSLPFQILIWFGLRSKQPITLNLIPLYNHLLLLLQKEPKTIAHLPHFYEFMTLLSLAQTQFTEEEIFNIETEQSNEK